MISCIEFMFKTYPRQLAMIWQDDPSRLIFVHKHWWTRQATEPSIPSLSDIPTSEAPADMERPAGPWLEQHSNGEAGGRGESRDGRVSVERMCLWIHLSLL